MTPKEAIIMEDQLDITDMGTYLGMIAAKLSKEGNALQALARIWHEKGNENLNIINTFGGEIINLGEQLLSSRNHLCKKCLLQEVKIILNFGSSNSPAEEKEADQD